MYTTDGLCMHVISVHFHYITRGPDRTDSELYTHKWLTFYHQFCSVECTLIRLVLFAGINFSDFRK